MKEAIYHLRRDQNNEIIINNLSVAEQHAQILVDEKKQLIIIDLSSSKGVKVNNEKISSPVKLSKGDIITLGEFKCLYEDIVKSIRIFEYEKSNTNLKSSLKSNISGNNLVFREKMV